MRVLNSRQMRDADRRTIEDLGIPSLQLMETAGRQVVAAMEAGFERLPSMRVAVLCGKGNNGGDGFVVARTLFDRKVYARAFLIGQIADVKGDARTNLDRLRTLGADVVEIADARAWAEQRTGILDSDLIVDALVGTGLNAPLTGLLSTVVADVNGSGRPVVAIDVPSGLSADSHEPIGPAIQASLTVTLATPKLPLVLPPAEALAGRLAVADIGIPPEAIAGVDGPWIEMLTTDAMRGLVTPRASAGHKGDYGRVLVVAGSRGKTGAAALSAIAALRSGAGLVTVATPASCLPIIASLGAEYMTEPLDESDDGTVASSAVDRILEINADVLAIGPGLGQSPSARAVAQAVVERARVPIVVDADGLNAFVDEADRLKGRPDAPIVITPHPGEMARLTGLSIEAVQARRLEVAQEFAAAHRVCVVLKGHRTVIASPDGKTYINMTGNPGMATGGTGDVLTGAIAAWIGQLGDVEKATTLAVHLHGLAGDLAAADQGEVGMIAGDVAARLGAAVLVLTGRRQGASSKP
ncbi:MAG TPA: NAD(P)H-hydrate dehydratase [Vicinamibacterales bacterium]|nr:NAD(P)H-hydrate dehydratase [Vicinamibacterales bacterium]